MNDKTKAKAKADKKPTEKKPTELELLKIEFAKIQASNKALIEASKVIRPRRSELKFNDVLDLLQERPLSEKEFFTIILESGSSNERRNAAGNRNAIRLTINSVFAKGGVDFKEELASKELIKALKDSV